MSKDNSFTHPFTNESFFKLIKQYDGMPQAFQNLMDIQLKSIKSINDVRQSSLDSIKEIANKQRNVFSQIMNNTTTMANDIIENSSTEDVIKKNAETIQKSYKDALSSARDISELLRKSSLETNKILRDRAKDSISSLKDGIGTQTKEAS